MLSSFKISFKLKNTYRVNTIIHSLKQIPVIKKMLPQGLYSNDGLKILGNIISGFMEFGSIFLGKLLYVAFMIFALIDMYKLNNANLFLNIIFFLTIAGALLNTYMFNPTTDKYYAMIIMRMDAKKYTLSNFIYMMLKVFIGFLPFILIFGLMAKVNALVLLIIPIFIVSSKVIFNALCIYKYEKKGVITDENHPVKLIWGLIGILIACAYGLPAIGVSLNTLIFSILAIIIIVISIFAWKYLFKYNHYYEIYRIILSETNMKVASYDTKDITKESMKKTIDDKHIITSNKKGYAYFNDLFVKRHNKILWLAAKKIAAIAGMIFIVAIIVTLVSEDVRGIVNEKLIYIVPVLTFWMYIFNTGQKIAQVMFMNCDVAMLTYGFYRQPKVVLSLFKERVKSIIAINLLPSFVISIGMTALLFASGGTTNFMNYILLFFSINAMSVFFSIHHLVLYYLLQPYTANSDLKSMTYQIANFITYMGCYVLLQANIPIMIFGAVVVAFSIIYAIVSLLLVYKKAPQTFKIRI